MWDASQGFYSFCCSSDSWLVGEFVSLPSEVHDKLTFQVYRLRKAHATCHIHLLKKRLPSKAPPAHQER